LTRYLDSVTKKEIFFSVICRTAQAALQNKDVDSMMELDTMTRARHANNITADIYLKYQG